MSNDHKLVLVDETSYRVAREAFVREDVLDAEYERIFDKCWLYVGHESEFKKAGVSTPG